MGLTITMQFRLEFAVFRHISREFSRGRDRDADFILSHRFDDVRALADHSIDNPRGFRECVVGEQLRPDNQQIGIDLLLVERVEFPFLTQSL